MLDFDPRDYDSRDDHRVGVDRHRGGRGGSDDHNRDDDWRQPEIRPRGRDDGARELGRGPGDDSRGSQGDEQVRQDRQQAFYADLKKPREVEHNSQVYRAYLHEAERLAEREARIERVVLDYELKREYQRWLHERDRERDDYDGHPNRDGQEIEEWALEHGLPYFDEQVHFPDLRIECEEIDGRRDHLDVEVTTIHYRGAHGAAVARSGFNCYRGWSARIVSRTGGGGGRHAELAEELLR